MRSKCESGGGISWGWDVICYESVEGVFEWLDGAGVVVSRAVCFGRFVMGVG